MVLNSMLKKLSLVVVAALSVAFASDASAQTQPCDHLPLGQITAGGAASDDFQLDLSKLPPTPLGAIIERDRMYMAERPGFLIKQLPLLIDNQGNFYSGGRYLLETYSDAVAFSHWLANDFVLDGVEILNRPYFVGVTGYAYEVIGGWRWQHVEDQTAMRVERWSTAGSHMPPKALRAFLASQLPLIEAAAEQRGLAEVYLAYSEPNNLVELAYFTTSLNPGWDRSTPDYVTLGAMQSASSLATTAMQAQGWSSVLDRSSWVFNTWFHFYPGDQGLASNWPNSPPLPPVSLPGDTLCDVSQGENSSNDPADCLPTCGNGVADPGENTVNCPSDVRLEPFLTPDPDANVCQ